MSGGSLPTGTAAARRWPRWLAGLHGSAELTVGLLLVLTLAIAAVAGALLQTHDPDIGNLHNRLAPPGTDGHFLGTDQLGRDIWSRLIAGLQWSLACALSANLLNLVIGACCGLLAAERPGVLRTALRQVADAFQSFPTLVAAIVVVVVLGHGFLPLVLTLGFLGWPIYMRVVFAEASSIYERDYVKAARVAGVSRLAIMFGHVVPGLRGSLMAVFALHFATLLTAESALSFLGIGAPLGAPTWGNMLAESRQYMLLAPGMLLAPAAAIILAVVTMNLLGDGMAAYARRRGRDIQ